MFIIKELKKINKSLLNYTMVSHLFGLKRAKAVYMNFWTLQSMALDSNTVMTTLFVVTKMVLKNHVRLLLVEEKSSH
jgi:hypothetical protein